MRSRVPAARRPHAARACYTLAAMNPYTNPYAPPQAGELYGAPPVDVAADPGLVPDAIVEQLRGTRPWVIFLAIVGFLFSGLLVLGGFGVTLMGFVAPGGGKEPWVIVLAGVFYLVFGALYVLPSVGLLRYGTSIGTLIREPRMERLGAALDRQRWFWKLVGIMTAIMLALYPIGMIVLFVVVAAKIK